MKKITAITLTVILSSVLFLSGCSSSSDKNEPLSEAPSSSSEDLAALPSNTEQDEEDIDKSENNAIKEGDDSVNTNRGEISDENFKTAATYMEIQIKNAYESVEGTSVGCDIGDDSFTVTIILPMSESYLRNIYQTSEGREEFSNLYNSFNNSANLACDELLDKDFERTISFTVLTSDFFYVSQFENYKIITDIREAWDAGQDASGIFDNLSK